MRTNHVRPRATHLAVFLLSMLLPVLVTGSADAAWISLGEDEGTPPAVRVLESAGGRTVLEVVVGGFEADPVSIGGRTYYRIGLPGEGVLLDAGMPELPHLARSIIIPDRERMTVRVLDADVAEFAGMPVVPSKGNLVRTVDPASVPYAFSPSYGDGSWFPAAPAGGDDPYILRDYRGMVVEAFPFRARGSDGLLRATRRMVIEIVADGPDVTNTIDRDAPPSSVVEAFEPIYWHRFLNYGFDRYTPVGETGRMLVICHPDFLGAIQPWVDWKMQAGIPTEVIDVSVIGNTTTAIQNAIRDSYNAGGLAFVLLVGDAAQVVTPHAVGGASDPTYALLAGSDRYPELLIGRFSAETVAQVQTQVARTIAYERTPMDGADWYAKGTGIGSDQGPGDDGEYDYQHVENIRTKLLNYGYTLVDQIYDPGATAAMVTNALNQGRSILNYCGHGSETSWGTTGFSNTNVNALANDSMLPFIFSVACLNGQFEGATCFGEAWMRATNNGNPTGAIGAYMSSINQTWNPPMCAEDEADDLLVNDEKHTFGALCFNGSCQMMDEYGAADGGDMFLTWHVFGDPSLLVRTKTPFPLTVQHDGTILIGQTTYDVRVSGTPGALCALYGDGILYGSALTDPSGSATIVMDPEPTEPLTLTLTVTAYNRIPFVDPVEVLPPTGPFVTFDACSIDDAEGGDGDGGPDAGETIEMTIVLKNVGVAPASGVTADLSTDDPSVEILEGSGTFGDIPPGESRASQAPYRLAFSPGMPDNHVVDLHLAIHAVEGSWDRGFATTVTAPVLGYVSQVVDDSPPWGNGTGWIGPGEVIHLSIVLGNTGHANSVQPSAVLQPAGPFVEIVDGTAGCDGIGAGGEEALSPFELRISLDCPSPSVIEMVADLTDAFGYVGSISFQLSVGGFLDDGEADRGWTLGAVGDNATTGIWVRVDPNGTVYNGNVVQPEDDHTPAPGVACFVTGNGSVGGAAGEQDVDGGKTTLLTPPFDLRDVARASVGYWAWYTNNLGNNPGQDYWTVEVTGDGTNWVPLEHTTESTNAWIYRSFALEDYLPFTDRVQIRFVADDSGANSLVEALIDDFALTVYEPAMEAPDLPARLVFAIDPVRPNPALGDPEIRFSVPRDGVLSLRVYDVSGRLVRSLAEGKREAGEHRISWDRKNGLGRPVGAGTYFILMRGTGFRQVRPVTLLD